jgi:hypothetical protein
MAVVQKYESDQADLDNIISSLLNGKQTLMIKKNIKTRINNAVSQY